MNMIFGFNTDVKAEGTVYHVQTEVHEHGRRLESQIFVSGRCIGKRSSAMPIEAAQQEIQELARAQHRWFVDAVRDGFVDDVLNHQTAEDLAIQILGSQRISGEEVLLSFRVLCGGFVAASVELDARWKIDSASGILETKLTSEAGVAELRLTLADGAAELEVRARLEGRETVRRFLVKSARA